MINVTELTVSVRDEAGLARETCPTEEMYLYHRLIL